MALTIHDENNHNLLFENFKELIDVKIQSFEKIIDSFTFQINNIQNNNISNKITIENLLEITKQQEIKLKLLVDKQIHQETINNEDTNLSMLNKIKSSNSELDLRNNNNNVKNLEIDIDKEDVLKKSKNFLQNFIETVSKFD